MLKIDDKDMFRQVVEEVEKHPTSNVYKEIDQDSGELILRTKNYQLKVLINKKWVGYDFMLDKKLTGGISQGSSIDTDLYPLAYDAENTKDVFQETLTFVDELLTNRLFYGIINKKAVFARPTGDREYKITYIPKRRFFATVIQEIWPSKKVTDNPSLRQLIANEK